jgi:hypothetical protein
MIKTPRTRNRATKPTWQWSGLDATTWRAEPSNVVWAQQDSRYKELVTVLTNERQRAFLPNIPPITENRALGRLEGYQLALDVLAELATLAGPPPVREEQPTYPPDNDAPDTTFVD